MDDPTRFGPPGVSLGGLVLITLCCLYISCPMGESINYTPTCSRLNGPMTPKPFNVVTIAS